VTKQRYEPETDLLFTRGGRVAIKYPITLM
jgi:hypothetical protein